MEEEIKVLKKVKLNMERKMIYKIYQNICSNLEGFSLRRIDELQEIIIVRQDLILLKKKNLKKNQCR